MSARGPEPVVRPVVRLWALALALLFLPCSVADTEACSKAKCSVDLGGKLTEETGVDKVSAEEAEKGIYAKRQVSAINSAASDVKDQRIENQDIATRQGFLAEKRTDGPEQIRNSTATNQTSDGTGTGTGIGEISQTLFWLLG